MKEWLLYFDMTDIDHGLANASEICGVGTAGASGLLALLYPTTFATVDQLPCVGFRAY